MEKLLVKGPCRLEGCINISGAKNASLPILLATILSSGEITLHNVPSLRDTTTILEILDIFDLLLKYTYLYPIMPDRLIVSQ